MALSVVMMLRFVIDSHMNSRWLICVPLFLAFSWTLYSPFVYIKIDISDIKYIYV